MMITSKGQVTIPKALRDQLGLMPNTHVVFELVDHELRLKKASASSGRGSRLVARMAGKGTVALSTDEILSLTRGEECPS
jgi:antitoxin PrlF